MGDQNNIYILCGQNGSIQLLDIGTLCIFSCYRYSIHNNINDASYI